MSLVQQPPPPLELDRPAPASPSAHRASLSPVSPVASSSSFRLSPSPPPGLSQAVVRPRSASASRASSSRATTPRSLPLCRTDRKWICSYEGCGKAYTKPSRLAEHELTHTGERPHACPQCSKTFLRDSHLRDHMRTHLSVEQKPFACPIAECGKRFWTAQHLKKHEEYHDRAECEECDQTFSKSHLLRDHITIAHMPEGTKPWPCEHTGCGASFALKSHLTRHQKTHDPNRYTCSHPSHGDQFPSFPVWSALQTHMHQAHPPICPHHECHGRIFKSAQRLREHLKVHADREADMAMQEAARTEGAASGIELPVEVPPVIADGMLRRAKRRRSEVSDGRKSPKLPRVIDGEAGKSHACDYEDCEKKFKTKFALNTHRNAVHLKIRNHTCPIDGCGKTYPHLATLNKHIASHSRPPTPALGVGQAPATGKADKSGKSALTGIDKAEMRRFGCPSWAYIEDQRQRVHPPSEWQMVSCASTDRTTDQQEELVNVKQEPNVEAVTTREQPEAQETQEGREGQEEERCMLRFWRVYDVRRHLKAEHGIELEDMEVRQLLVDSGQTGERA